MLNILLLVLQIPLTRQFRNGVGFRKLNDFDYNFKDWNINGTQSNLFDYNVDLENLGAYDAVTNTLQTNTTPIIYVTIPTAPTETMAVTTTKLPETSPLTTDVTSIATDFKVDFVSVATEPTIIDVTTIASSTNETASKLPSTPIPEETETTELIMTFPETTTTPFQWTTLPPHLSTFSLSYPPDMTFPDFRPTEPTKHEVTTVTEPTTTESAIAREFKLDMEQINGGYLTTFLFSLFKIIPEKTPSAAQLLFHTLETEVIELQSRGKLTGFGRSTVAAMISSVEMLNSVRPDSVQSQASIGKYLMMNRDTMGPEILALLEEIDKVYKPEEGKRIIKVVEDLYEFPKPPKTAKQLVHEMIEAVILAPMKRMYGTTKEKVVVQKLDELVVKLYFSGFSVVARRWQSGKQTTELTKKKKNITTWNQRTKKIKTLPTPLTKTRKTIPTTIPNKYAVFSKNETIKKAFKHRLMRYKMKRDPKRWWRWRSKWTTTTTTTEKTTRVARTFKSIYVMKRYVHKKMKKRKVKIVTNDTGTFELIDYEDLVSKTTNNDLLQNTLRKDGVYKQKTTKLDRGIAKGRNNSSYGRKKIKRKRLPTNKFITNITNNKNLKDKKRRRLYSDLSRRYTVLERNNSHKDFKLRSFLPNNDVIEDSSLTEEEKLKANLDDALFHEKPIKNPDFENFGRRKIDSSYSDDEAVLKSRIYKVFGYENDFAAALRRGGGRREFK